MRHCTTQQTSRQAGRQEFVATQSQGPVHLQHQVCCTAPCRIKRLQATGQRLNPQGIIQFILDQGFRNVVQVVGDSSHREGLEGGGVV